MTNEDSYHMMHALRHHLSMRVYEVNGRLETALYFRTVDGKIHQLCSSHEVKKIPSLLKEKVE
jgi:hypothetical protein